MADQPVVDSNFEKYLRSIPKKGSAEHAEVLLLTCIDYRFFTIIAQKLHDEGLEGKYDHFILAGASLGAGLDFNDDHLPADKKTQLPRTHWQQVFIEHLQIATKLHPTIHTVIVIDHRDCGAYKFFLKPEGYATPDEEKAAHKAQADKLVDLVYRIKPTLTVTKWLASLSPAGVGPLDKKRKIERFTDLGLEQL